MFKRWISAQIKNEIDSHFTKHDEPVPPTGYLPLEIIRQGLFHWILVPFEMKEVWCKVRCLNSTQLNACGGVTLVEAMKKAKDEKIDFDKLIDIRNIQEKIIRDTLISPTFEEIEKLIFDEDNVMQRYKKEIEEIEKIDKSSLSTDEKEEISKRLKIAKLSTSFVLPENTFAFLTSWALGLDRSDIKKISDDILLGAAFLAIKGNDNPTDHIRGLFTDRDPEDLNQCAWLLHGDYMHRKEIEYKSMKGRANAWNGS